MMLTTQQIRAMIVIWPGSRLRSHITGARKTTGTGCVATCARHVAIMRAELKNRAYIASRTKVY